MSRNRLVINSIKLLVPLKIESEFFIQLKVNSKEIHNTSIVKYVDKTSSYSFDKTFNISSSNIENIKFVMMKKSSSDDENFLANSFIRFVYTCI